MSNLVAQVYLSPAKTATINIYDVDRSLRHDFILVGAGTRWGLAHVRTKKEQSPPPQGAVTLAALVEAAYFGQALPPKTLHGPLSGRFLIRDGNRKIFISGWVLEKPTPRPSK